MESHTLTTTIRTKHHLRQECSCGKKFDSYAAKKEEKPKKGMFSSIFKS